MYIDPLILFTRLSVIIQREGCVTDYFKYELTAEPTSLFKGGLMRKAVKSSLRNYILKRADGSKTSSSVSCVIDGGALLHKVKWTIGSTFEDVMKSYQDYIQARFSRYHKARFSRYHKARFSRYHNVYIVFDGYDDKLSIKATEHKRKSLQSTSPNVNFTENMILTTNRETFLNNHVNKDQFIKLLCKKLLQSGINTLQSKGDADVLIIKKAIEEATKYGVDVVAEDTDILILLIYHWNQHEDLHDMYFNTELKVKQGKIPCFYHIISYVAILSGFLTNTCTLTDFSSISFFFYHIP